MEKVKITVLRKMFHLDMAEEFWNPDVAGQCPHFMDGQEFITDWFEPPEGFPCTWAWHDIYKQFYECDIWT